MHQIFAAGIFLITFFFIVSEKLHRTVAAVLGGVTLLLVKVIDQQDAVSFIDYTTIGVLIGMMIIISIIKRTGLFQYLAIKSAKIAKGDPKKLIIVFGIVTAVISALLDNVTTVLLMAPVTMVIAKMIKINPIPFMMTEVICSNIGGTATLIGDPPNIMIGSATGISFAAFLANLGPVIFIILAVTVFLLQFIYRRELAVADELKEHVMTLDENSSIVDKGLLIKSLIILGIVVTGFFLHNFIGYESSVVALAGAALLLLVSKADIEEILIEIEWSTIFFFAALFVLVGTLEEVGIIPALGKTLLNVTNGNLMITGLVILWGSAIISAFLDNIPFVAAMIPLIKTLGDISGMDIMPLWWALSLGACLGGNGSLVGASANVVVAGMMAKEEHKITFGGFLKTGFPLMILSVAISTVYLVLIYLR
ncbi:MAG: ArsB/NhaD family transporter [Clostridiaceae bacterium]